MGGTKIVSLPFRTLITPIRLQNPTALTLSRTYVYCNNPAMGFFEASAERARTEKGWRYRELATGHDAMVTLPRELVQLLCEVV